MKIHYFGFNILKPIRFDAGLQDLTDVAIDTGKNNRNPAGPPFNIISPRQFSHHLLLLPPFHYLLLSFFLCCSTIPLQPPPPHCSPLTTAVFSFPPYPIAPSALHPCQARPPLPCYCDFLPLPFCLPTPPILCIPLLPLPSSPPRSISLTI